MNKNITVHSKSFLGDMITPMQVYAALRDRYPEVFLLESSDYHAKENAVSLICFDSLYRFTVQDGEAKYDYGDDLITESVDREVVEQTNRFINSINTVGVDSPYNGVYGYAGFDAIQYYDTVQLKSPEVDNIPEINYHFFRYILVINPFNHEYTLLENCPEGDKSHIDEELRRLLQSHGSFGNFEPVGEEFQNMTDEEYMEIVSRGKHHCQIGDVFQIVLSRRFSQQYEGDDLNLYRALRSINPSPYLYYFDFGGFRIMGSSPEAEIIVEDREAQIHPIAGTYRRSGNDETDRKRAIELSNDPKESSEHIMLVDLARNDLSRNCEEVEVKRFKEVQYFSHVIHLVSNVVGKLHTKNDGVQIFADTFPAGTLSGAPKYKAVELIDHYEPHKRGFYGGAIGYIGFNGNINHAIMIRTFLSKDDTLHYQAGAGVVISSKEESERDEVNNKLAALKAAIQRAEVL